MCPASLLWQIRKTWTWPLLWIQFPFTICLSHICSKFNHAEIPHVLFFYCNLSLSLSPLFNPIYASISPISILFWSLVIMSATFGCIAHCRPYSLRLFVEDSLLSLPHNKNGEVRFLSSHDLQFKKIQSTNGQPWKVRGKTRRIEVGLGRNWRGMTASKQYHAKTKLQYNIYIYYVSRGENSLTKQSHKGKGYKMRLLEINDGPSLPVGAELRGDLPDGLRTRLEKKPVICL